MNYSQFIKRIEAQKDICIYSLEKDHNRAIVEIGGYIQLLLSSPIGKAIITSWTNEIENRLSSLIVLHSQAVSCLDNTRDSLKRKLELFDVEHEWAKKMIAELEKLMRFSKRQLGLPK